MTTMRGDHLPSAARHAVLAKFVYRWTVDNPHRRGAYGVCPVCKVPGGEPEPTLQRIDRLACRQYHPVISLKTDAEWLRAHYFRVTSTGRLDARQRWARPYV